MPITAGRAPFRCECAGGGSVGKAGEDQGKRDLEACEACKKPLPSDKTDKGEGGELRISEGDRPEGQK